LQRVRNQTRTANEKCYQGTGGGVWGK
jgi:hypothetical protein